MTRIMAESGGRCSTNHNATERCVSDLMSLRHSVRGNVCRLPISLAERSTLKPTANWRLFLQRLAFDLDETFGVPLVNSASVVGWQLRPGCPELLDRLQAQFALLLWSVSPRRYVDKALGAGLSR